MMQTAARGSDVDKPFGPVGDAGGEVDHDGHGAGAAEERHGERDEGDVFLFARFLFFDVGLVVLLLRVEHLEAGAGDEEAAGNL